MKDQLQFTKAIIKRLLVVLFMYMIFRIIFYIFNFNAFDFTSASSFLKALWGGIRFDISAICATNTLVIILGFLPFRFRKNHRYQWAISAIFIVFNSLAFLLYFTDLAFFRQYERRLYYPTLHGSMHNIDVGIIWGFLKTNVAGIVLWVVFAIFLIKVDKKLKFTETRPAKSLYYYPFHTLGFFMALGLTLLGIRGGVQYKPLDIINAGLYASSGNFSLVTNNPFVLIKTAGDEVLNYEEKPDNEKTLYFNPIQSFTPTDLFKKKNVVIIILESFSKEFIGILNPGYKTNHNFQSYAPFLDSLIPYSVICTSSFANDENSIRSLPNILSGIPSWMNDEFTLSVYAQNKIESIATVLKENGYYTAFFHGGKNGTMNFDSYVKAVGFDHYYGMDEYPEKSDFDGKWGIADHAFFSFFANKLKEMPQPFVAGIFSLSSHDPYKVPDRFANRFNSGKLPIHNVAAYADFSLRQFFSSISGEKWFNNTVFVITADHGPRAVERFMPYYKNIVGKFAVPIIFYQPSEKGFKINKTAKQTDIFPTLMGLLNYEGEIFCFGNNLLTTSNGFVLNRLGNDTWLLVKDSLAWVYDNGKPTQIYNLGSDSLLQKNLINTPLLNETGYTEFYHAMINTYTRTMTKNIVTPERYKFRTKWTE